MAFPSDKYIYFPSMFFFFSLLAALNEKSSFLPPPSFQTRLSLILSPFPFQIYGHEPSLDSCARGLGKFGALCAQSLKHLGSFLYSFKWLRFLLFALPSLEFRSVPISSPPLQGRGRFTRFNFYPCFLLERLIRIDDRCMRKPSLFSSSVPPFAPISFENPLNFSLSFPQMTKRPGARGFSKLSHLRDAR